MRYPVRFEADPDGGFVVSFRDIPEALTQGDTLEEARDMALDALVTSLEFYFEDQRSVPLPSQPEPGEDVVTLPASVWAKVLLLNLMVQKRVKKADLARMIDTKPQEITRLVDLHHATKIDQLQRAIAALGGQLHIAIA
jgi:antitoxin HicB